MEFVKIYQEFDRPRIPEEEIGAVLREECTQSGITIPSGGRIAVAVGSRGISNLPVIVKTVVEWLKDGGAKPFIVPAMGSHGGATAEGQKEVLAAYSITEAAMGVPVESSMDVVELPSQGLPNQVYMDKKAYQAEGTVIINRVKMHTAFRGAVESGLAKMCVIGLGKHRGAQELHSYGVEGLRDLIPPSAEKVLDHGRILGGIAVGENAYEETALLRVLRPEEFAGEEPKILDWSRRHMPSLPADNLDVLVVEEFGKDISGTGMDVNIIGRMKITGVKDPEVPKIGAIVLLDLTENSHGNATGMGLADIITRRFYEKIDFQATYENVLTHCFFERGKMPVIAETEAEALDYALKYCRIKNPEKAKVLRIKNTLVLDEMWASRSLVEELSHRPGVKVTGEIRV